MKPLGRNFFRKNNAAIALVFTTAKHNSPIPTSSEVLDCKCYGCAIVTIFNGPSIPDGSSGESALYGAKSVNVYFFTA